MPIEDVWLSSVIFNGNILYCGYSHNLLFIYSIDIDSFSTVPYIFPEIIKRLISTEDRLYLLGLNKNLVVYESEDEYSWKKIAEMEIPSWPSDRNWIYNKGGIYMQTGGRKWMNEDSDYLKFRLDTKKLIKLKKNNKPKCLFF